MLRFALMVCGCLWLATLVEINVASVERLFMLPIYTLASLNFVVYSGAMYLCRKSNRALIVLVALSIISFMNNLYLLVPLIPPHDQLIGGALFLGWYLILQAVLATSAVFVQAYATDESLRYELTTFPNGKILAAPVLGLPAIAFLAFVYFSWP